MARLRRNKIKALKIHDEWCYDEEVLKDEAISFFRELYTDDTGTVGKFHVMGAFPTLSRDEVRMLDRDFTQDEIKKALFDMSPLKAPGIDGFHAQFFQSQWGTVGDSIYKLA